MARSGFEPSSHAVNGEFGISEIAKARSIRTSEIFAATRRGIDTGQVRHGSVCIRDNDRPSAAEQIASDRAGAANVIVDAPAIAELHRRQRNDSPALSQREKNKRKRIF